jgi:hypothetical protein
MDLDRRTFGHVEGQNLLIEYRYAEGDVGRLPARVLGLTISPSLLLPKRDVSKRERGSHGIARPQKGWLPGQDSNLRPSD